MLVTILNKPATLDELKKFIVENSKPNQVNMNFAQNRESGAWQYQFEEFADTDINSIICDSTANAANRFAEEMKGCRFDKVEAKRFGGGAGIYIVASYKQI